MRNAQVTQHIVLLLLVYLWLATSQMTVESDCVTDIPQPGEDLAGVESGKRYDLLASLLHYLKPPPAEYKLYDQIGMI